MAKVSIFKIVRLPNNEGHGNARRKALDECYNNLVALMDADGISSPNRFAKQLQMFVDQPDLDICGGHITEFIGDKNHIVGRREVKLNDNDIKKDLKKRCPLNQVTVMFKKQSYYQAGGYVDWYCEEDYYLWARMVQNNHIFSNVDSDLVNVRVGLEMSSRRCGWKYFKSERKMQKYLLSSKIIGFPRYLHNVGLRFVGEVLTPNWLRAFLFMLIRKPVKSYPLENTFSEDIKHDYPPFSVAMCVYGGDNPEWLDCALNSVLIEQTIKPDELILVIDGPIPETIESVVLKYKKVCEQV